MSEADTILEIIACKLEDVNMVDLQNAWAKKKRDREDAALRMKARQDQRAELADWVRSFKSGQGNDHLKFLKAVAEGEDGRFAWGPEVATAIIGRLVDVSVEFDLSSHMNNADPKFHFTITDKGNKILERSPLPTPPEMDPAQ